MDSVNEEASAISEKDRKAVAAYSLRFTVKRMLIVGLIGLILPYVAIVIFFIGLPVRGLFTPKRAKSVFVISVIWVLAMAMFVGSVLVYVFSQYQYYESRKIGDNATYCSLYEQSKESLDSAPDAEITEFIGSHVDKLRVWYNEFKKQFRRNRRL